MFEFGQAGEALCSPMAVYLWGFLRISHLYCDNLRAKNSLVRRLYWCGVDGGSVREKLVEYAP